MIYPVYSSTPHVFQRQRDATTALSDFCDAVYYVGLLEEVQFETVAVFDSERAGNGFQVRVKDLDGFGVGYIGVKSTEDEDYVEDLDSCGIKLLAAKIWPEQF